MIRTPQMKDQVIFSPGYGKAPMQAEITMIWSPTCVNLLCQDGSMPTSVYLLQDHSAARPAGYYCEYEPAEAEAEVQTEAAPLPPYQQRVVDEKTELDAKLTRLREFLCGQTFSKIDRVEQNRLFHQAWAMGVYSKVLGERIEAFPRN